ncbi:unnamed protein product [Durusdinium trenchii]|uniref:Voltage-dependent L-type calcium channel subunit alpha-1S n=2 Tax=Durusdinium trenchii TaxID=1381693 RepID=A0ABP0QNY8_9DINO
MLFADGEMPKNLKGLFPDVGQSMFVLFLVMNSDFEPVQDLLSQVPVSQLFIALFIVISNWAILAIFTAVVSENMITTVENRRMKLEKDESTYRTDRSLVKLKEFFEEIKPGEHELIYTHEFTTFLNDPDKEAELCDAAGISSQDLKDLLKLLSHKPVNNDRSYILEKDFLSGLKQQNDAANERSMMRLEKQIMALEDRLRHWMEEQDEIPKPPSAVSVSPIRLPRYAGPTARGRPRGNVDVPAVAPSASASP